MNDTEGALVGDRYRLDQPIGRGRAGIVWLAFDTMLHRTVAAKRLYIEPDLPPDRAEEARKAALHEGRQATRILHANAITVYDAFRDGNDVWLVMEYVPSRNMADFLAEHGQLTPEQAAFLGVQLGSALAVAHALGVPHRVVEPSNVLLADDGGVKITDIGIAGGPPDPAYRAPEVAKGEPATAGADTYSLGATLFAAVEGVPPFGPEGTSEPAVPNRTGALTGALLKMLRTDPDLRPTMADSVAAFKAITRGQDQGFVPPTAPAMPTVPLMPRPPRVQPQAPAPPPPKQRRPGPRVRPWQWWIVAVVVVTIIIVGIILAL
ncbi:serine/threonine-protein kinase [Prauserella endophytica]|uniref:non-specific serine/threonine protein kinase n=1 Tax=Prauserella endophytica TaxID=1592324 RepID=A0ABY2S0Q3_9PSEU|nr:serine/threonine-protein kinase [Prauserella endophytica]PXY17237.1 serine/threonine protein kinase [Prauserella coralliicola]TKG67682.1 serine/threonine protein kinase [Prauserella endophytica]